MNFREYKKRIEEIEGKYQITDEIKNFLLAADAGAKIPSHLLVPKEIYKKSKQQEPEEPKPKRKKKKEAVKDITEITFTKPDGAGELPLDIMNTIDDILTNFCERYNIEDLRKASAQVWRSACINVGFMFKQSQILKNENYAHGGQGEYDARRIEALINIWSNYCGIYDKAPLISDFISFTGVSRAWFYNSNGVSELTSASVQIVQKVQAIQEAGLSSVLVDGRRNPTGTIFFLKNWHGWKDQREIIHNTDNRNITADLPQFNTPELPEKSSDDGQSQ